MKYVTTQMIAHTIRARILLHTGQLDLNIATLNSLGINKVYGK